MPVRKILVVDDSATNRHAISEMLARHGYRCVLAAGHRSPGTQSAMTTAGGLRNAAGVRSAAASSSCAISRRAAKRVLRAWTIEDLRQLAKKRLPRAVFDFFDGGAEDE